MTEEYGIGSIDGAIVDARFVRAYPPAMPEEGAAVVYLPFHGDDLVTALDYTLLTEPPTSALEGAWGVERLYMGVWMGEPVSRIVSAKRLHYRKP